MSTYQAEYRRGIALLEKALVPDARADAWYLLEYAARITRAEYLWKATEDMPEEEVFRYAGLLKKRAERIPLQHITGVQEFMGFEFRVSEATLIPRQDTEVLVEEVRRYAEGKTVLDLCTGTGCIILSLAGLCPLSKAVGTDIAEKAILTAEENAKKLGIKAEFYCGDLYEALPQEELFDIIVSNPPYIPTSVIPTLMPEVRDHEPVAALDGEADGLCFYRRIIRQADRYLKQNGRIFFEIGCEQAEDIRALLAAANFKEICVKKDYAGLDRVVSAVRS